MDDEKVALGYRARTSAWRHTSFYRRSRWNDGEHAMTKADDRPWTAEEDDFAQRMNRQMTRKAIGKVLGRTKNAVTGGLRLLAMTPEERRNLHAYRSQLRQKVDPNDPPIYRPTPEMLHDRDVRSMLPHRDLTGAFLGDPPVGLSALEGRR